MENNNIGINAPLLLFSGPELEELERSTLSDKTPFYHIYEKRVVEKVKSYLEQPEGISFLKSAQDSIS